MSRKINVELYSSRFGNNAFTEALQKNEFGYRVDIEDGSSRYTILLTESERMKLMEDLDASFKAKHKITDIEKGEKHERA